MSASCAVATTPGMVFFDESGVRKIVFTILLLLIAAFVFVGIFGSSVYLRDARIFAEVSYAPVDWKQAAFDKTITLTFDDGPDPVYTPALMATLTAENVPGTFFLVGEQAIRHPFITRSLVENGFEIGNHSLTHSRDVHRARERIHREIVSTDRILSAITGRSTIFYRPPFLLDNEFGHLESASIDSETMRTIEEVGPIVVGADAGGEDWEATTILDAETIYTKLVEDVHEGNHVILLHDPAGHGASVEAIRMFIPAMKAEGYHFVPLSYYFGLTRDQAMPQVGFGTVISESLLTMLLFAAASGGALLHSLVLVMVVVAIARIWLVIILRRVVTPFKRNSTGVRNPPASVTVIIPAHNEAANVAATIHSAMSGSITPHQVIVVNDSSTDETPSIVEDLQTTYGSRLVLLQRYGVRSKADALNTALLHATSEIVVCIDADTIFQRHALRRLLRHFADPSIGAVAGKVYPASLRTFFEKLQYLEYVQSQNLDKEVFSLAKAVNIVPGALGAWRKKAIIDAGGYSRDTVVEDQDLTLALLLRDWRIVYEPEAIGFTETPSSARSFFAQRFRWIHGTMQCFRKYEEWFGSIRRARLGYLVLPNILLFNLMIPLAAPLIDLAFILSLFGFFSISIVATTFVFFMIFDLFYAYEGLRLEEKPRYGLLLLIPLQRWMYRYIVAAATAKSVLVATMGTLVTWTVPLRRGTAQSAWASVQVTERVPVSVGPRPATEIAPTR